MDWVDYSADESFLVESEPEEILNDSCSLLASLYPPDLDWEEAP
jgi:hypothetical protein